jgi:hypothetical protein
MNPYAERELKTPKLNWNIEVQNIAIELTKPQVRFIWIFLALIRLESGLYCDYSFSNGLCGCTFGSLC